MTSNSQTITIGIVTRNRPDSLSRALASIRMQSVQPDSIIVSDDSDESYSSKTRIVADEYGCRYQIGPRKGLYANRNAVALASHSTHFRTMDDDHEMPLGHMAACTAAIVSDPHSIWIIGEHVPNKSLAECGQTSCPGQLAPRGYSRAPNDPQNCFALACGATIFPQSVIEHRILNIQDFRFGASYLEYGCRLACAGYRIRHLSTSYVLHHIEEVGRSYPADVEYEASYVFAMLALAYTYDQRLFCKALCWAELVRRSIRSPRFQARAILLAITALKEHHRSRTGPFSPQVSAGTLTKLG
jgi:hypothetical protein